MSLPSTLQKLRIYREWLEYSKDQEYENYDDRWQEFLEDWRYEKSIGMLAESFSAGPDSCEWDEMVELPSCSRCGANGDDIYFDRDDGQLRFGCHQCMDDPTIEGTEEDVLFIASQPVFQDVKCPTCQAEYGDGVYADYGIGEYIHFVCQTCENEIYGAESFGADFTPLGQDYWCSWCGDDEKASKPQNCINYHYHHEQDNPSCGNKMCVTCYNRHEGLCYSCYERAEMVENTGSYSFSSEDDFDEASWGEDFVEQVYSGEAAEMMYLELWLYKYFGEGHQRQKEKFMNDHQLPDDPVWKFVYDWWNEMSDEAKENAIDEDIFVKYYNDALESYGDYEPFTEGEAEDFMAEVGISPRFCCGDQMELIVDEETLSWIHFCPVCEESDVEPYDAESFSSEEDFMAEESWMSKINSCGNNDCDDGHCPNCGSCKNWAMDEDEDGRRTGMYYCGSCSHRFNAESFSDWADNELKTHGKNVTFGKWVQEEFEDEPLHRHPGGGLSFVGWAKDEMQEKHHNAEWIFDGTPFWSVIKIQDDGDMDSDWGVEDHDTLEDAKESYDYYIENEEGEFAIMKNDNMGEGQWEEESFEAETFGAETKCKYCNAPLVMVNYYEDFRCPNCHKSLGAHRRKPVYYHDVFAAEFCSECGPYSKKDAESFSAETSDGNQVFNSCWKCGSGQHLYQISRYPASPEEIAGIGMDPDLAVAGWESQRPRH